MPASRATLLALAALALSAPSVFAHNVGAFTSATISVIPNGQHQGIPPQPLDLDLTTPEGGIRVFSIPPASVAIIEITGVAASTGIVAAQLMDNDRHEFLKGFDDVLDDRWVPFPVDSGETFTLRLYCFCDQNASGVDGYEDSGEQDAEIYVKDGALRIPAGPGYPGGPADQGWWKIDCDKTVTETMFAGGDTLAAFWGDTLVVPPGALAGDTEITVSNMYPLLDAEQRPGLFAPISEALRIEPEGLALATPATLVFRYSIEEVGEIADPQTLRVFKHDPVLGRWMTHGPVTVVDLYARTVRVEIDELGTYGFAPRLPQIPSVSQQQVATDFGDNTMGQPGQANGSELDQLGFVNRDGMLYLFLGGNLESNFNKLELFFDTGPGGQNRLRGDNADVDFGALNRMGDDGGGNGLTFDPGFEADHWIGLTLGDPGDGEHRLYLNYATLPTDGAGEGHYLGETRAGSEGYLQLGANPFRLRARVDNSNVAGVGPGCDPAFPGDVPSGIELAIPLTALGAPNGCIRVCAFVNGAAHDFVSNQFLGPLPPGTCNLGEPRFVDLGAHAGDQFVELCVASVTGVDGPAGAPVAGPRLLVRPNPSDGSIELHLAGARGAAERIEVLDLLGRRVRALPGAALAGGVATWDGRTDAGDLAPAGIYLVRVRGAGFEATARVVRVR